MKKIIAIGFAAIIGFIILPGCKKKKGCTDPVSLTYDKDAEENDGSCQYGGLGGSTTLVAYPQHHDSAIVSTIALPDSVYYPDSVFIKFNAVNSPGNSPANYDIVMAGDSGEEHVHIHDLKPGKYFIYMTGWDNRIFKRVYGGISYELRQSSGEVDLIVPVSE